MVVPKRVVVLVAMVCSVTGFLMPAGVAPRQECRVKTAVLRPNEGGSRRSKRQRPKKKQPSFRKMDPSLELRPLPLLPDELGNWETAVAELWTVMEERVSINEKRNTELDYSRFRKFLDTYRTQRGVITGPNDRVISAQTRFLDIEEDATPFPDMDKYKFTGRLAARVHEVCLEELADAFEKGQLDGEWSRLEIMAVRDEPWQAQPAQGDEDATKTKKPEEAMRDPSKPPPSMDDVWSQLLLNHCNPLGMGIHRFPKTMEIIDKFKKTRPLPRNLIVGRLPAGVSTTPRSDLWNTNYVLQVPLANAEGCYTLVGGEKKYWKEAEPVVFDPTFKYSMHNEGKEDALVLHMDFWRPEVEDHERNILLFFWLIWQQDRFHPSTRSFYNRRAQFYKEIARKEREIRMKQIKRRNEKRNNDGGSGGSGGGGGGSIARK